MISKERILQCVSSHRKPGWYENESNFSKGGSRREYKAFFPWLSVAWSTSSSSVFLSLWVFSLLHETVVRIVLEWKEIISKYRVLKKNLKMNVSSQLDSEKRKHQMRSIVTLKRHFIFLKVKKNPLT